MKVDIFLIDSTGIQKKNVGYRNIKLFLFKVKKNYF